MKKILLLVLAVFCIGMAGCCSIPRTLNYKELYSFTRKEEKIKRKFGGSYSAISIKDFRENERYDEEMAAFKEKVEQYILSHPDLSESAKNNLRQFKVSAGASTEEVELLLGKPDRVAVNKADNTGQVWIYKINKRSDFTVIFLPVFFGHEQYYLYFKDNLLALIERHYLEQTFSATDSSKDLNQLK
ncbi:MAG: hypothetical protein FJZ13_00475 [Candidatus Omnitrophica bacterium]|nr:hypothetical protein [Candidatus Omnitrophota bacterium]